MTPSQQILAIAKAGHPKPVWPEAFIQAVRALGYPSFTIERVHAHPTKPEIEFEVVYGFRGDTCSDEHSLPFHVLDAPDLPEAMGTHLALKHYRECAQRVHELQADLQRAEEETAQAHQAYMDRVGTNRQALEKDFSPALSA